jgi:two-component system chemotaxis response regulator CheB
MSIRVLVVEDSPVVGAFLNHVLSSDPYLQVIGTVRNGTEALQAVRDLRPDVITMDIAMPVMDGYEATRRIMETDPVPIVIVSVSVDRRQLATTFRAIEAGALAAVQKPFGVGHPDHDETARILINTVKAMSEVKLVRRRSIAPRRVQPSAALPAVNRHGPGAINIIAMGASIGGPSVLQRILSEFPGNFPIPVLIVQHISPGFIQGFAESLTPSCKLPVSVAKNDEILQPGHVYLAPDGLQMGVGAGRKIILTDESPESDMRPSASYLFRTVADAFGTGAAGVILTGMGNDGAEGLMSMRKKGAVTIAQDEASCVVFGMPGEAVRLGAAKHVLSPEQIALFLLKLAGVDRDG